MTKKTMKDKLRALVGFNPADEVKLDISIDEGAQFVWDADEWTWKKRTGTFTPTAATHQLPVSVDNILELTYGTNNRVVYPKPSQRVAEIYSNQPRTATGDVYYYSLDSASADRLTIELTPNGSGLAFKYRYNVKHDYGSLSEIPEKLHSLVFTAARMFLASGVIEEWSQLTKAMQRDKPIRLKRWTMGVDPVHAGRVYGYNVMISGTSGDVTHPID